jgi:hypothetical protein
MKLFKIGPLKIWFLALVFVFFLFAFFINDPSRFGFCFENRFGNCVALFDFAFRKASLILSAVLLVATVVASFFSRKVFYRWLKFTTIYGIIISGLLLWMPELGFGMGGVGLTLLDIREFSFLYAILYVLISAPLLIISEVLYRRSSAR